MSLYYSHTLIPQLMSYRPRPFQVQQFLEVMIALGVVPAPATLSGMKPSGQTREFPGPFGEPIIHEVRVPFQVARLADLAEACEELSDYEVSVGGAGRPKLPPLPIDCAGDYSLDVTCQVSSALRSTSNPHDEFNQTPKTAPYRSRCAENNTIGYFVNPHTDDEILVPDAGCARFWIEFRLGKNLLPIISGNSLDLLEPSIVDLAGRIFEAPFLQGCEWAKTRLRPSDCLQGRSMTAGRFRELTMKRWAVIDRPYKQAGKTPVDL